MIVQQDAMVAVAFERGVVAAEVRFEIDGKRMGWIQSSERTGLFYVTSADTWVADRSVSTSSGEGNKNWTRGWRMPVCHASAVIGASFTADTTTGGRGRSCRGRVDKA